jgi:hypothetical protein
MMDVVYNVKYVTAVFFLHILVIRNHSTIPLLTPIISTVDAGRKIKSKGVPELE